MALNDDYHNLNKIDAFCGRPLMMSIITGSRGFKTIRGHRFLDRSDQILLPELVTGTCHRNYAL
jgi:hypothetical protein